jgi:hypothetical protein
VESGTLILLQLGTKVIVTVCSNESEDIFEVNFQHTVPSLSQLFTAHAGATKWMGMVGIPMYAKWVRQTYGFNTGPQMHAVDQALPYAVKQGLSLMRFHVSMPKEGEVEDAAVKRLMVKPVRDDWSVLTILAFFLNNKVAPELPELADGMMIEALPLVKLCLESLAGGCGCGQCSQDSGRISANDLFEFSSCVTSVFVDRLSFITAMIIFIVTF